MGIPPLAGHQCFTPRWKKDIEDAPVLMLEVGREINGVIVDQANLFGIDHNKGKLRKMFAQLFGNVVEHRIVRYRTFPGADDNKEIIGFSIVGEAFKIIPVVKDGVIGIDLCFRVGKRLLQMT